MLSLTTIHTLFLIHKTHVLENEKQKFEGLFNGYELKGSPAVKLNTFERRSKINKFQTG